MYLHIRQLWTFVIFIHFHDVIRKFTACTKCIEAFRNEFLRIFCAYQEILPAVLSFSLSAIKAFVDFVDNLPQNYLLNRYFYYEANVPSHDTNHQICCFLCEKHDLSNSHYSLLTLNRISS